MSEPNFVRIQQFSRKAITKRQQIHYQPITYSPAISYNHYTHGPSSISAKWRWDFAWGQLHFGEKASRSRWKGKPISAKYRKTPYRNGSKHHCFAQKDTIILLLVLSQQRFWDKLKMLKAHEVYWHNENIIPQLYDTSSG